MRCFALFLLLNPGVLLAEGLLDRFENNGVTIRKSFNGTSKDAASPAEFSYQNPDQGKTTYKVDLAAKIAEIHWFRNKLRLNPVIEHHRNSLESKETNKTSAGAILQFDQAFGSCNTSSGQKIAGCYTFLSDFTWKRTRDSQNDVTTGFASAKFGINTGHRFAPGWTLKNSLLELTYYPTIGIESYNKQPITTKVDGEETEEAPLIDEAFYFTRISVSINLLPDLLEKRLSLIASHSNRKLISTNNSLSDNNEITSVSLNYYFDSKQRFGIGLSYKNGRDPNRNFLDEESSSIGIKIKI